MNLINFDTIFLTLCPMRLQIFNATIEILMVKFDTLRHWSLLLKWLFWKRRLFGLKNRLCVYAKDYIKKVCSFVPQRGTWKVQLISMTSQWRILNRSNSSFPFKLKVVRQLFMVAPPIDSWHYCLAFQMYVKFHFFFFNRHITEKQALEKLAFVLLHFVF